jgi:hypothetical protein
VKPRRPPSLPLICGVFPEHSSFSVFRETSMAFFRAYFKELNCYGFSNLPRSFLKKPGSPRVFVMKSGIPKRFRPGGWKARKI